MKKVILFFLIGLNIAFAQTPTFEIGFSVGSYATGKIESIVNVKFDQNGNKIVAGTFTDKVDFNLGSGVNILQSDYQEDIFIAKYNASGDFVWAINIGNANGYDEAVHGFTLDASGNIIIKGSYDSNCDFDPSAATKNLDFTTGYFLAKYTSSGTLAWAIDAPFVPAAYSYEKQSVDIDGAGNILTTGAFSSTFDFDRSTGTQNLTPTGLADMYIAKYSPTGAYLMAKKIGNTSNNIFGVAIDHDSQNNIVVVALNSNFIYLTPPSGNLVLGGSFVVKFDAAGNILWGKNSNANAVGIDANDNIWAGGSKFLTKFATADGTKLFEIINCQFCNFPSIISLDFDPSNNIYVTGTWNGASNSFDFDPDIDNDVELTENGVFIAKYDLNGNFGFAKMIGVEDAFNSASFAGNVNSITYDGSEITITPYGRIVDLDPSATTYKPDFRETEPKISATYNSASGNYLSYFYIPHSDGGPYDVGTKVLPDNVGNAIILGTFGGVVDFDPSNNTNTLSSPIGQTAKFIAKFSPNGSFIWAKTLAANIRSFTIDASNNIYLVGDFKGTVDFDPSASTFNLNSGSTTATDAFIAKYDLNFNLVWAKNVGSTSADESIWEIEIDTNGDLVMTGAYFTTFDIDPSAAILNLPSFGSSDFFITKFNSSGNLIWANAFGNAENNGVPAFCLDASNNIIIMGSYTYTFDLDPSAGTFNITGNGSGGNQPASYVAKYNSSGGFVWGFKFSSNIYENVAGDIRADNSGNIYLGNYTSCFSCSPTYHINKYSSTGTLVWQNTVTGQPENILTEGSTNLIVFSGNALNFATTSFIRFFNQSDGVQNYSGSITGAAFITSNHASIDANGDLYITGSFNGTADFDIDASSTYNLSTPSDIDMYFAKYNRSKINSIISGNWNANTTWDCNCTPTLNKTANVVSTHTVTVPNSGNQVKKIQLNGSISISNGGNLQINN